MSWELKGGIFAISRYGAVICCQKQKVCTQKTFTNCRISMQSRIGIWEFLGLDLWTGGCASDLGFQFKGIVLVEFAICVP